MFPPADCYSLTPSTLKRKLHFFSRKTNKQIDEKRKSNNNKGTNLKAHINKQVSKNNSNDNKKSKNKTVKETIKNWMDWGYM